MVSDVTVPYPGAYRAVIAGTGSYVPAKTLTNEDFTRIVDTSDEWITSRTGIKVRHIAGDHETTAMLAAEAARIALADAGMEPTEIDLIIVATITPEMVFPSTACFVQHMLGGAQCMGVRSVCRMQRIRIWIGHGP